MKETFELPVSLRIRSSRDRVFAALTDPALASEWLCERVEGSWRPGGIVHWHFGPVAQEIRVIEVQGPELLKFRWNAYVTEPETEIEMRLLVLDGSHLGETGVKIRESRWELSGENVRIALDHACGWENLLCRLKAWLEAGIRI